MTPKLMTLVAAGLPDDHPQKKRIAFTAEDWMTAKAAHRQAERAQNDASDALILAEQRVNEAKAAADAALKALDDPGA